MAQVSSRRAVAIVAVLGLLVVASVWVDRGRTFIVTDMQGARVGGVYVAHHREGTTFALVEAPSYRATPQSLTKSDPEGRVVIPPAILLHWPLIQSPPRLNIDDQTAHLADELCDHFKQEYAAILARHGDMPRPRPPMPAGLTEQERAATDAMIDKDLPRGPCGATS